MVPPRNRKGPAFVSLCQRLVPELKFGSCWRPIGHEQVSGRLATGNVEKAWRGASTKKGSHPNGSLPLNLNRIQTQFCADPIAYASGPKRLLKAVSDGGLLGN